MFLVSCYPQSSFGTLPQDARRTSSSSASKPQSRSGVRSPARLAVAVFLCVFCHVAAASRALALDLRGATIFTPAAASVPEKKAAVMLRDEVAQRTRIQLKVSSKWPSEGEPVIAIGVGEKPAGFPARYVDRLATRPIGMEGYRVQTFENVIAVVGNSPVAAVFGVGYLLRHLHMESDPMTGIESLEATEDFRVASSPHHRIRGYQFNYRDWTNSYDGWTPQMFEQYVRDMAVFGANAVELMGPGPDNDKESPHFPLSKIDMLVEASRIASEYGMQVWIFFPVWGSIPRGDSPIVRNYDNPSDVEISLKEWAEVFRRMPRIDAVLAPGGDPGHTEPRLLMPLLEKQTANLRRFHPAAEMWMTPQQFPGEWMDQFFSVLKTEPKWLTGVGFHSAIRMPLPEFRAQLPARYPIRLYADITHSVHGEYTVPEWDLAFMVTHGREPANPRPVDMAKLFRYADPHTIGSLIYSEGVNDDFNKVIFSALEWNPNADINQIAREYARYFHGARLEEDIAQAVFNLERNWRGPLLSNPEVDTTFMQFRRMEQQATPRELLNWRFQQLLYRAYFDYYVKTRLLYETALERQALETLRGAGRMGSLVAIDQAEQVLDRAVTLPIGQDLRTRLHELAAVQYQSIRAQLAVDRYRAKSVSRGATLDSVDTPLNSRHWWKKQFAELRQVPNELTRLDRIETLLYRTEPGPGGFYDDLGNPGRQPHLDGALPWEQDPGRYKSPRSNSLALGATAGARSVDAIRPDGAAQFLNYPVEWWSYEETRFEWPLTMRYRDLDRRHPYKLRVVYLSRSQREARIRLVANNTIEIHPYLKKPPTFSEMEFDVPPQATVDGELRLEWQAEPGGGGTGAGPMICEVFLIRK
jgi:hypothetical protein